MVQVPCRTRPPEKLRACERLPAVLVDSLFWVSEPCSSRRQVLLGSSNRVQKVVSTVLTAEGLTGLGGSNTRSLQIRTDCLEIGFELTQTSPVLVQTRFETRSAAQHSLQVTLQLPDSQALVVANWIERLIGRGSVVRERLGPNPGEGHLRLLRSGATRSGLLDPTLLLYQLRP